MSTIFQKTDEPDKQEAKTNQLIEQLRFSTIKNNLNNYCRDQMIIKSKSFGIVYSIVEQIFTQISGFDKKVNSILKWLIQQNQLTLEFEWSEIQLSIKLTTKSDEWKYLLYSNELGVSEFILGPYIQDGLQEFKVRLENLYYRDAQINIDNFLKQALQVYEPVSQKFEKDIAKIDEQCKDLQVIQILKLMAINDTQQKIKKILQSCKFKAPEELCKQEQEKIDIYQHQVELMISIRENLMKRGASFDVIIKSGDLNLSQFTKLPQNQIILYIEENIHFRFSILSSDLIIQVNHCDQIIPKPRYQNIKKYLVSPTLIYQFIKDPVIMVHVIVECQKLSKTNEILEPEVLNRFNNELSSGNRLRNNDTSKKQVEEQKQVQNVQRNTASIQQPLQQVPKTYSVEEKLQQRIKALNLNINKPDPKEILQDLVKHRTVYEKLQTINSSSNFFENIVAYGELQSHQQNEIEFSKLFKRIDKKQLAISMFVFEHYLGIMGVIISFRQPNKHFLIYDEVGKNLVNFKESFKPKLDLNKIKFNIKIKFDYFKQIFLGLFVYYGQRENIQAEKVIQLAINIFSGDVQTYLDILDLASSTVV